MTELQELYRGIIFTILVSNDDDHPKNHGFLFVGAGSWRLAPAFDINPQPDRHPQLNTGISKESRPYASVEAAIEAGYLFDFEKDDAATEVVKIATCVTERWERHCLDAGMARAVCKAYAPAFNHDQMKFALNL